MQALQQLSTESTERRIDRCISLANKIGVPRDQLERFLRRSYVPFPWQLKFHAVAREADAQDGPVDIGVGGARGPGKSHAVLAQMALDDCQRVPNLKGLFLRQTGKSASESFEDLIGKVLLGRIAYHYNTSRGVLKFRNGSKIILGGFEDDNDIDKYIGIEYDLMGVEERNQLTNEKITKLKGSLRTSKENWRPRMYSSFNPGSVGHNDVKQTFVVPFREGREGRSRFVPSTYRDNVFLDKTYVQYLENLPGALGKAWRDGNFDTFSGQFFSEWDNDQHVIAPFTIPVHWKRFRSYDHGRTNPASCGWYALGEEGQVIKYREYYPIGLNVDQIAAEINRLSLGEVYEYSVADPAIFAKMGFVDAYGGQTIAESFARQGINFIPASNRRIDGWGLTHQYLHWDINKKPKLQFFSTCYNSIRTIPSLVHDEHRPEDVDTDGEDHVADEVRYLLMSLHERVTPRQLTEIEKKLKENKEREEKLPYQLYNG